MTFAELEAYLLGLPNTRLDYPFGKDVAVYKVKVGEDEKMFALMPHNKDPLQISLKCDPQLAIILRKRFETVLEGYHLSKKHWNTILVTGQLDEKELTGLVLHSYNLVIGEDTDVPDFS